MEPTSEQVITEVRPQGKSARRLEVLVGGEVALEVDREVAAQHRLAPGRSLTGPELEAVRAAGEAYDAGQAALRLLGSRPRSRVELTRALRAKRFPAAAVEVALQRLQDVGLVDDAAFARRRAEELTAGRGLGRYAVARKLAQAGIRGEASQAALAGTGGEEGELERARQAADKYLRRGGAGDPRARVKLYQFLARRGFESDLCRQVTQEKLAAPE